VKVKAKISKGISVKVKFPELQIIGEGGFCANATAIVVDQNQNEITTEQIASGATKQIEVNIPQFENASVRNSEGVEVFSLGSGEFVNIPKHIIYNADGSINSQLEFNQDFNIPAQRPIGKLSSHTALAYNNLFGNSSRFTDLNGTQNYINNIVLDHLTEDIYDKKVLGYYRIVTSGVDQPAAIAGASSLNIGGFSGFSLPSIERLNQIRDYSLASGSGYNFAPFNIVILSAATSLWSITENPADSSQALIAATGHQTTAPNKTGTNRSYIAMRWFTYAELGL
jgi:hypothetical protein